MGHASGRGRTPSLSKDDLAAFLEHLVTRAGDPGMLSGGVKTLLVDHAAGNPRILCTLAGELLEHALQRGRPVLDEALYLNVFDRTPKKQVRA